jgi:hypothetical protein
VVSNTTLYFWYMFEPVQADAFNCLRDGVAHIVQPVMTIQNEGCNKPFPG